MTLLLRSARAAMDLKEDVVAGQVSVEMGPTGMSWTSFFGSTQPFVDLTGEI